MTRHNTRKKLKIAVLVRNFVITGGAERYAFQVSKRLAGKHEVHVFCQTADPALTEGFVIHRVPGPLPGPSFLNQLFFSHHCGRMVDDSFDIVQSHERVRRFDVLNIHCPCYRGFLTRARGVKKALSWLGELTSPRGLSYLWLEKNQFTARPGRRYIADSAVVRDDVIENYGLDADLFTLAYPGVELTAVDQALASTDREKARADLGLGADDIAVLFVGTEFRRKGLDALMRGFAMLREKRTRLIVAGGGGNANAIDDYRRKAQALGIAPRVTFTGLVGDIYPLYIAADIFCLPTLSDPCPIAPIEAMACGAATIMSNVPWCGTAEHIKDGEAIILDDPRDPDGIAAAIGRLSDPAARQEIAEKGRTRARTITWEAAANATISTFDEVMANKSTAEGQE